MNYSMIRYTSGWVLKVEGALMVLPLIVALIYGETQIALVYIGMIAFCVLVGFLIGKRPANTEIHQKDGLVIAALSWLVLSIVGAIPFVITGEIPNFVDALFEIVSGFTTTGSSILRDVEAVSHGSLFWRSFSHWIGGMGVLVFILMIMPAKGGSSMNIMKAESPGPDVGKFVPKVRETAKMLYKIYIVMTLIQIVLLLCTGMHWFDSCCISFGSAGTGGFGVLADSCGSYTPIQQWIITIFMALFGINFGFYFLIVRKRFKAAIKMEEVIAYIAVILVAIAIITWQVASKCVGMYGSFGETLRHVSFQVSSIITTTGYSTTDFDLWTSSAKWVLVVLMFIGACAGSTGGGIKVSRILILGKTIKKELQTFAHPRSVHKVKMDGVPVAENVLRSINVYLITYVIILALSVLIVSFDGFSMETNFTAVAATLNNIGPGLAGVGPTKCFADYSILSKVVLIFDMLAGRLELFPVLMLFVPNTWRS